jgi:cytochrome c oxidase subunit 3
VASAYIFRKGVGTGPDAVHAYAHPWKPLQLPYRQLLINSLLLLLSSVALEMARRDLVKKAEFVVMGIRPPGLQREISWLTLTVLLAFGFLGGQLLVWDNLRSQGIYLHTNPSSSFFYLLTGLHAVHLIGGLLVLLYALLGAHWMRRQQESRQIVLDATGWYWHFMGLLWFAIFALLHFFRQ